jgi:hypothetical protein
VAMVIFVLSGNLAFGPHETAPVIAK